jgi:pyruvate, water dikinase
MIYKLDEITKKDVQEVGGKAANLGELIKFGFNVPKGFVCTAKENKNNIYNRYNKLKLDKVAVRSSAICEDGTQNSYAGQFETFLNIDKEEIIKSVEKCYESNRSENIKGYINEKNIVDDNTKVSVIVQEMIDGDISGVMFTKNPVSGDDTIIIESVLGLGEKLVQGEVTPAQIIINKNTLMIANKVGIKMLSKNEIESLSKIGLDIERFFKAPQDIEWSLKNGKIYILQTRNITTL